MFNRSFWSLQQKSSNNNYSLHQQRVFSQDWLNFFCIAFVYSVFIFILQGKRLINTLKGGRHWLREISVNVEKFFIVFCVFCLRCPSIVVFACLLFYPFFYIHMLLLYLCLFVDNVNNVIISVFGACVYHFNNTIFIFATIYIHRESQKKV